MNQEKQDQKTTSETDATCGSKSAVERFVGPAVCWEDLPEDLWRVGDIVSRDGTDEHEILAFNYERDLIDVKCVKEPAVYDGSAEPWTRLGETESNLTRRYTFVRPWK